MTSTRWKSRRASAGKRVREIPTLAWEAIRRHRWPGNVRELRKAIESCVLLSEGEVLPFEVPDRP